MATTLSIIQTACQRLGLDVPSAVSTSSDTQIVQLLALLNEENAELATGESVGLSYDWTALQTQATFTTVAQSNQGLISTIAPGFRFMIPETIWNRSTRLPAYGSLSPQDWQAYQAWGISNPYPQFRIQGKSLLLLPIPTAGQSYYFEYQTSYSVTASDGVTLKSSFTADTDVPMLSERLLIAGVVWRWKCAKGLEYAEDFRKYQTSVLNVIGREGSPPDLCLGDKGYAAGVIVPIGNWNH